MRVLSFYLDRSYRLPVVSGYPQRIDLSMRSPDFLPTYRCREARRAMAAARNYCPFKHPSSEFRAKSLRFDWSQSAPAEVTLIRSGLRLSHGASVRRKTGFTSNGARNLTGPIESRRLRVSCTKTSPQQTDPPTSHRLLHLPK